MDRTAPPVNFLVFQGRLLDTVRFRLRNGEWTERGLAHQLGVSQPHVHNVLKGIRTLTPALSDLLLHLLDMSLLDLVGAEELHRMEKLAAEVPVHAVGVAAGTLGPWRPWPDLDSAMDFVHLRQSDLEDVESPVLVRLGEDAGPARFPGARMALLDRRVRALGFPAPRAIYAVEWNGAGHLARLRLEQEGLRPLGQLSLSASSLPPLLLTAGWDWRKLVRARLVWAGADLLAPARLEDSGRYFEDAASL
jgi:hypothetical protein